MTFRNDNLPTEKNDHFVNTTPFSDKPLWNLLQQMDSFFNQFFNHMNTLPPALVVNTSETDSEVIVEVNLPGCNRNQIQLEIIRNRLRIGIEDSLQEEIKYETHTGRKQFYSRREHIVSLPFIIPEKEALTTFHNEVLRITIPKKDTQRSYLTINE
ncbi:Hsp20/alpha crystallin family protein [Psychrobacillus soli]|uniref:Hsp20/alpha crystallin family protein n=1 Tax=Psychrobacillus soli TaxID=1543965 RepID=A0A544TB85_9BACI|nr:Hsp20/alpha crystallin family protein [Psychrobacillus soli]TQR14701.1 Hsp20/alpha crystallin family protein [Psychrobacillus soli]